MKPTTKNYVILEAAAPVDSFASQAEAIFAARKMLGEADGANKTLLIAELHKKMVSVSRIDVVDCRSGEAVKDPAATPERHGPDMFSKLLEERRQMVKLKPESERPPRPVAPLSAMPPKREVSRKKPSFHSFKFKHVHEVPEVAGAFLEAEYRKGVSIKTLSDRHDIAVVAVRGILVKRGVSIRVNATGFRGANEAKWSTIPGLTRDQVVEAAMLYSNGYTLADLESKYGVSKYKIVTELRAAGVVIRPKGTVPVQRAA